MGSFISRIREPVKRGGAENYLLITLLSFASSVVGTRIYLELTGYPQLGNGTLHVAHVLWGGLFLYIAALLPLLLANRAVYTLGALLSGIGAGLFIDEVGKFITQSNDYFYPAAAPIIYAFFLLTVLLYLRVRRPPSIDARAELYRALDALTEVLDHDLDPRERASLEAGLRRVAQQMDQPELARLGEALLDFLAADTVAMTAGGPGLVERAMARLDKLEARYLSRGRFRTLLIVGLAVLAVPNIVMPMVALLAAPLLPLALFPFPGMSSIARFSSLLSQLTLLVAGGIPLLIGAFWLFLRRDRLGIGFAYFGLLLSLTVINLLLFYFDQFRAVGDALLQFGLLLAVIRYRRRFLGG